MSAVTLPVVNVEEKLFQKQLDFASSTKGITVKQLKKDGCVGDNI